MIGRSGHALTGVVLLETLAPSLSIALFPPRESTSEEPYPFQNASRSVTCSIRGNPPTPLIMPKFVVP
jgi:hypothetical protein